VWASVKSILKGIVMTCTFRRQLLAQLFALSALTSSFAVTSNVFAQTDNYPSKSITLVVPNPPGGLVDTSARLVSDPLAKITGQTVVVDNKPGGSGNLAYSNVARSAKDGYTVLVSYSGYHIANPILMDKLPWELKDLTPVGLITVATNVIAVHPSIPVNTLKEFIAWAKQNPGKLNYASQGNGSVSHIGTEIFKQQTGIEMTHVPYKGSGQAIQDVLAGQVQVFITTPPSVMGHVLSGKLKALAVTGKTRHPQLPQVPTVAEAGLSGFELESWVALYVASGTPKEIVQKLSNDVKRAMEQPDTKQRADAAGVEVRYLTPDATTKLLERDTVSWTKAIKSANIKFD
jgi:tripartite-type tricarboxylate transporter receptor subunit TctC